MTRPLTGAAQRIVSGARRTQRRHGPSKQPSHPSIMEKSIRTSDLSIVTVAVNQKRSGSCPTPQCWFTYMMGIVKKAIRVESKTNSVVFMDLVGWINEVDGSAICSFYVRCNEMWPGSLIFHWISNQDNAKSKSKVRYVGQNLSSITLNK